MNCGWTAREPSLQINNSGPSLKAAPYSAMGKSVIFVPSYYKKPQPQSPVKQSPRVVPSDIVEEGRSASQAKKPQPDMETEISEEASNCDTFQKSKISTNREFIAPILGASSNKSESIPIISSTNIFGTANNEDLFRSKLSKIEIMSQA